MYIYVQDSNLKTCLHINTSYNRQVPHVHICTTVQDSNLKTCLHINTSYNHQVPDVHICTR